MGQTLKRQILFRHGGVRRRENLCLDWVRWRIILQRDWPPASWCNFCTCCSCLLFTDTLWIQIGPFCRERQLKSGLKVEVFNGNGAVYQGVYEGSSLAPVYTVSPFCKWKISIHLDYSFFSSFRRWIMKQVPKTSVCRFLEFYPALALHLHCLFAGSHWCVVDNRRPRQWPDWVWQSWRGPQRGTCQGQFRFIWKNIWF